MGEDEIEAGREEYGEKVDGEGSDFNLPIFLPNVSTVNTVGPASSFTFSFPFSFSFLFPLSFSFSSRRIDIAFSFPLTLSFS